MVVGKYEQRLDDMIANNGTLSDVVINLINAYKAVQGQASKWGENSKQDFYGGANRLYGCGGNVHNKVLPATAKTSSAIVPLDDYDLEYDGPAYNPGLKLQMFLYKMCRVLYDHQTSLARSEFGYVPFALNAYQTLSDANFVSEYEPTDADQAPANVGNIGNIYALITQAADRLPMPTHFSTTFSWPSTLTTTGRDDSADYSVLIHKNARVMDLNANVLNLRFSDVAAYVEASSVGDIQSTQMLGIKVCAGSDQIYNGSTHYSDDAGSAQTEIGVQDGNGDYNGRIVIPDDDWVAINGEQQVWINVYLDYSNVGTAVYDVQVGGAMVNGDHQEDSPLITSGYAVIKRNKALSDSYAAMGAGDASDLVYFTFDEFDLATFNKLYQDDTTNVPKRTPNLQYYSIGNAASPYPYLRHLPTKGSFKLQFLGWVNASSKNAGDDFNFAEYGTLGFQNTQCLTSDNCHVLIDGKPLISNLNAINESYTPWDDIRNGEPTNYNWGYMQQTRLLDGQDVTVSIPYYIGLTYTGLKSVTFSTAQTIANGHEFSLAGNGLMTRLSGSVTAQQGASFDNAFDTCYSMTDFDKLKLIIPAGVSIDAMFARCSNLDHMDCTNINASGHYVFGGDYNLTKLENLPCSVDMISDSLPDLYKLKHLTFRGTGTNNIQTLDFSQTAMGESGIMETMGSLTKATQNGNAIFSIDQYNNLTNADKATIKSQGYAVCRLNVDGDNTHNGYPFNFENCDNFPDIYEPTKDDD